MLQKRQLIAIFYVFFLVMHGVAGASSPSASSNVTQDWAYSAIEELGRGRDISGFDIPKQPNRNQGALLVARLLQHLGGEDHMQSRRFGVSQNVYLDSMIFSYNQRVEPEKALTTSQVELLYRLVLEFGDELEILGWSIQDFKLLYAQSFAEPQGGMFTERKLLYSEQVLAAARRGGEQQVALPDSGEQVRAAPFITEIVPEPIGPRSLWTGQFSSVRSLPASSSFSAIEPIVEPNPPIQIGSVEVSGGLRPSAISNLPFEGADSASAIPESGVGYGISMRMGDVSLNTAVDLGLDSQLGSQTASTSVGLSWDWADLFTLSAGVRLRDTIEEQNEQIRPLVTSLGVVVPINRGRVHLGMTQEWNLSEVEGNVPNDDELTMSAAELGLSYDFKNDSSLRFNYRFIDFSKMEPGTEAEAAFSIKF